MAEKRAFEKVICVKINAKHTQKFELFPAQQWKGGPVGKYRLRINRKWYEPHGVRYYLDPHEIGALVMETSSLPLEELKCPDIPVGTAVSAPTGEVLAGTIIRERTYTLIEPFLGYDKRWYVAVRLLNRGRIMVAVDELVWTRPRQNHISSAMGTGTSEHSPQ